MAEYKLPYSKDILAGLPARIDVVEGLVAQLRIDVDALAERVVTTEQIENAVAAYIAEYVEHDVE